MANPYFLRSLGLTGFRAYLQPKTFDFSKKRCLAIFAPNGGGKSSVIDALEFIFSKDGTLERLGTPSHSAASRPSTLIRRKITSKQMQRFGDSTRTYQRIIATERLGRLLPPSGSQINRLSI